MLDQWRSNLANNRFASACDSRRPIISFGTRHLPGNSWPSANLRRTEELKQAMRAFSHFSCLGT